MENNQVILKALQEAGSFRLFFAVLYQRALPVRVPASKPKLKYPDRAEAPPLSQGLTGFLRQTYRGKTGEAAI